ncbi:hypothetical protein PCANC_18508 [Puccinia coronata f. sp. avenae]|uniref:Uncharacterized protein n=1 Tax=Puccinia coronata f. sp. avenae TaxID=200324 RepID=A0A2N5SPU9_9BASI|nr:hypothetical protein PCANC_18508 [Puccinia coronata f. sp. avenae]
MEVFDPVGVVTYQPLPVQGAASPGVCTLVAVSPRQFFLPTCLLGFQLRFPISKQAVFPRNLPFIPAGLTGVLRSSPLLLSLACEVSAPATDQAVLGSEAAQQSADTCSEPVASSRAVESLGPTTVADRQRVEVDPLSANDADPLVDPALARLPHPTIPLNDFRNSVLGVERTPIPSVAGDSSAFVARHLTEENLRGLGNISADNTQTAHGHVDEQRSLVLIGSQQGRPSQRAENLNAPLERRNFHPATQFLLQTHLAFREQFLLALAANNVQGMEILRAQAVRSHRSLEDLVGRDPLLVLTAGWNPITVQIPTQANQPAPIAHQQGNRPAPMANQQGNQNLAWPTQGRQGNNRRRQAQQANGPARPQGGPQPAENTRMRNRQGYRELVFGELFRMSRVIQGGYQSVDQARQRNRGNRPY